MVFNLLELFSSCELQLCCEKLNESIPLTLGSHGTMPGIVFTCVLVTMT